MQEELKQMSQEVVESIKKYQVTGTVPWDYRIAIRDMPVQVGSLTKLLMQLDNERFANNKSSIIIKNEIADELADILSLVLFIAHELGIDIKHAWQKMLDSDINKQQKRAL